MSRIDIITGRLESTLDRIERLQSKPMTDRRAARLEKLQARAEKLENRLEKFNDLTDRDTTGLDSPDEFQITFSPGDNGFDNVEVNVVDSLEDTAYTAGDPLFLEIAAQQTFGRKTKTKVQSFTLTKGDDSQAGFEQSFDVGGKILEKFDQFDQFTISVFSSDAQSLSEVDKVDYLATQTFDVTDLMR